MRSERWWRRPRTSLSDPPSQNFRQLDLEDATEPQRFAFASAMGAQDPPLDLHDVGLRALSHALGDSHFASSPGGDRCAQVSELTIVINVGVLPRGATTAVTTDRHREVSIAALRLPSGVPAGECDWLSVGVHWASRRIHKPPSAQPTATDTPSGDHRNVAISEPRSKALSGVERSAPEKTRTK